MSKPKRERSLADNEAKAVARMLRVSPQKLNLVAQLIRGRKAAAALADLHGVEKLGSESAMMKDISKAVTLFRRDTGGR